MFRKIMLTTAGVAALAMLIGCSSGAPVAEDGSSEELVFVNYGGSSMDAAVEGWLEPYTEETGVTFITDSPSDPAKVKAMVEADRTTWDIVDLDIASGAAQCGVLFEERGPEVDMSAVDPNFITDDCGVPALVAPLTLVYNKDLFADNPPTKLTDFLDTESYPGQRIIWSYAAGGFEPLLAADGVPADEIYPLDYERAGEVIDRMGPDLTLQATLAQQNQSMESGDFAMCICYAGRAAVAAQNGANVGVVWDSALFIWDAIYAVKNSNSPEVQQEFLNYVAMPEVQARFTEHQPYAPSTPSSDLSNVPDEYMDFLPNDKEDEIGTAVYFDTDWWVENIDEALDKWTQITAG